MHLQKALIVGTLDDAYIILFILASQILQTCLVFTGSKVTTLKIAYSFTKNFSSTSALKPQDLKKVLYQTNNLYKKGDILNFFSKWNRESNIWMHSKMVYL